MPDMVEIAQQGFVSIVEAGIAKKNTLVASFGYMIMHARAGVVLAYMGNRFRIYHPTPPPNSVGYVGCDSGGGNRRRTRRWLLSDS
jgi:hypothetical protein